MRRNVRCLVSCLAALAAFPPVLGAQQTPELNEIVVTATRIDSPILDAPSFVTVITGQQIENSGAADLSSVLSQQSGVVINNYGPPGMLKTVSIRGSTSSQVLILVDGIRQNSSFDGWVDISRIPLDGIDHVEIVRGGASSLWGTGAVGGVINIITTKPTAPSIDLRITNGSYIPHDSTALVTQTETTFPPTTSSTSVPASASSLFDNQKVAVSLAGRIGELGLTGGGSFTRAANAFTWNDTTGSVGWRQRNNAQDLSENAFAGLQTPLLGGTLAARTAFDHSLIGVPGSLTYVTSQSSQEDTTVDQSVSYSTDRFLVDSLSLDVKASYRYWQEALSDPQAASPAPTESLHTSNEASLDLTQKLALSTSLSAVYGGSGSYEVTDSTNLIGVKNRISLAGFLSVPFSALEALTITPSVRYDYYSDFPGSLSYQLGAVLRLSDEASLRASVGSAYRVPTFSDLYWTDSYGDMGNPDLKPETSYSGEIGGSIASSTIKLDASAFTRLVFNQIDWGGLSPVNISESLLPGAELHASVSLTEHFSIEADYTFIYSFILQYLGQNYTLADNLRVQYVPVHNVSVVGRYTNGIHSLSLDAQYLSEKETLPPGQPSVTLPGFVVMNADYRVAVREDMIFSLGLHNLLNTLYYQASGYPMPPFSVETGVQLHL